MSSCPECSRFFSDTDLPCVWIILHNGSVRGVREKLTDALTQAHFLAIRYIHKDIQRMTSYVSSDGAHQIKVERYIVS